MENNKQTQNLSDTAQVSNDSDEVKSTGPISNVVESNQNTSTDQPILEDVELSSGMQQTPEMQAVLETINDDLEAPVLTQEQIDAKKETEQQRRNVEKSKKTFGDNVSRVASNGRSRIFIILAIIGLVGGGTAMGFIFGGKDEMTEADLQGAVNLPNAKVSGEATYTKEQAQHERLAQEQAAQQAQANGQTYVPPVIVERDADQQLLGESVVPGVGVQVDANGRPVTNNLASAGLDPSLGTNGGVASSTSVYQAERNANNAQQTNYNSGNQQHNSGQPQPVTPTVPQDLYAGQIQTLENSEQNVQKWQNGIAQDWIARANKTEEVAQTAFSDQLANLLNNKPKRDNASVGINNRHIQYSYMPKKGEGTQTQTNVNASNNGRYNYVAKNSNLPNGVGTAGTTNPKDESKPILIRAGTSYVAQLVSEVNTDEGAEVIGRITSGPYKDAQLLGTVKAANSNVQFVFTRLIPKKGEELAITAVAREIGTNKLGMADKIYNHTFKRYAGMVAASAMSGYGEAWQDIGTVTTNGFGGTTQTKTKPNDREIAGNIVGEIGEQVSSDIRQRTTRPPTYITYSGKVFNIYFNQNATEK